MTSPIELNLERERERRCAMIDAAGKTEHAEFEVWAGAQKNPPYYLKLNKYRLNEGNRWYDSERTQHTYEGYRAALAASEANASSVSRATIGAKMPCGAVVTNVYEAYEAGKLAGLALPAAQGEPTAWQRKWDANGETPKKTLNANKRMAWEPKFRILPITKNKIFRDDVPLFAGPSTTQDTEGEQPA